MSDKAMTTIGEHGVDWLAAEAAEAELAVGVGFLVRTNREAAGLSLEEVARSTRIPLHHLRALEEDRLDDLPSRVYARGFIRLLAKAIGLDREEAEEVVRAYERSARPTVMPPPPIQNSQILTPLVVRERRNPERGRVALGLVLLALAGIAIPIVAFLIS